MNKESMRGQARGRLSRMTEAERSEANVRIAQEIWNVEEVARARVILLYASMRGEVDTDAIAAEARRRGVTLTYPRCLPETRAMVLHSVGDGSDLRESAGIAMREPDSTCPVVDVAKVEVALVPGLAWDPKGTRLGRGKGYYDRLFTNPAWKGFKCGLYYEVQRFDWLPSNRMDAPLDAVVTEEGVTRF